MTGLVFWASVLGGTPLVLALVELAARWVRGSLRNAILSPHAPRLAQRAARARRVPCTAGARMF